MFQSVELAKSTLLLHSIIIFTFSYNSITEVVWKLKFKPYCYLNMQYKVQFFNKMEITKLPSASCVDITWLVRCIHSLKQFNKLPLSWPQSSETNKSGQCKDVLNLYRNGISLQQGKLADGYTLHIYSITSQCRKAGKSRSFHIIILSSSSIFISLKSINVERVITHKLISMSNKHVLMFDFHTY